MTDAPCVDHRDTTKPQPEVCDLCGERWPGADMIRSDAEGVRGLLICGSRETGCARFREGGSYKHRRRLYRPSVVIGPGKHPVFEPGGTSWWDEDDNSDITNGL